MSMRLFTVRLIKHGRHILRSYCHRDIHSNIAEQNHLRIRNRGLPFTSTSANVQRAVAQPFGKSVPNVAAPRPTTGSGLFRVGQHARKLFVDNILNRVTSSYSQELRQRATRKLFYGDSAPFFALIGVSLASGSGVLTKEDELEGVCWEIRDAASRMQDMWNKDDVSETLGTNFNIDQLEVGPPIAKGCAAVVYAASFKQKMETPSELPKADTATMSPLQNMSRFVHNFGGSGDNLQNLGRQSPVSALVQDLVREQQSPQHSQHASDELSPQKEPQNLPDTSVSINRYPLALKMMFNYDIQSNALSILRAMYKETVPARQRRMNVATDEWERLLQNQTLSLPTHPNIVCMFGFFCDEVRNFPDGHLLYPVAQPQRINPEGYGRNMSLYLLMKRYDISLRDLLDANELSTRSKILMLAQLLEAVTHLNRHGFAHRDLKTDNILIEMNEDDSPPLLVLSDFGCCLADKANGLKLPYGTHDIDKGGNAALMAPEIINMQPGPFAVLNYSKADLWACGALAYEIFGRPNPFYAINGGLANALRNSDYKQEDLPTLGDTCPPLVQHLVHNILNPNPSKRVSTDIAANVLQLFLWAPSSWLKAGSVPNSAEILQWLLSLTTKIMCEGRPPVDGAATSFQQQGRRTYVEYLLICSFLARAHLRRIRGALNWIQNVIA